MKQKQDRMSLKCQQPFFDLPAQLTITNLYLKFLTFVFLSDLDETNKLIMNQKQHRISLKWLPLTFNASTDTPYIPSRTITLFRFFLRLLHSDLTDYHDGRIDYLQKAENTTAKLFSFRVHVRHCTCTW